jgi:predicted GNAT family N-acyltransferase
MQRSTSYNLFFTVHKALCSFPSLLVRLDETAEHFLLRLLSPPQPIGIGTIRVSRASLHGVPYYKLSRLAVLNQYRKHHFGRELVLALHEWVVADALGRGELSATVVCHSQISVQAFYAK